MRRDIGDGRLSGDYQLRRDVDHLLRDVYNLNDDSLRLVPFAVGSTLIDDASQYDEEGNPLDKGTIDAIINNLNELATVKLGLDQAGMDKFNFALISDSDNHQIDYWILVNAFYDYTLKRFIKIDNTQTSFGIQLQATGTYAGEEEIDPGNTGVNLWRNPAFYDINGNFIVYTDTSTYDYTDVEEKNHIGAKKLSDGTWVQYAIASGWNNAFMLDSYGGMTIGGAGFEVDGNGIFPFTRLTHSMYTDDEDNRWALFGLLDNAYHATFWDWGCDSNATYSWFVGLRSPISTGNMKDNTQTEFIVMYNDTPYNQDNQYELDVSKWHIVFRIGTQGVI